MFRDVDVLSQCYYICILKYTNYCKHTHTHMHKQTNTHTHSHISTNAIKHAIFHYINTTRANRATHHFAKITKSPSLTIDGSVTQCVKRNVSFYYLPQSLPPTDRTKPPPVRSSHSPGLSQQQCLPLRLERRRDAAQLAIVRRQIA